MILPGTTYRTKTNKVRGTLHFNQKVAPGLDIVLPVGMDFEISLWTEPEDQFIPVCLKDAAEFIAAILASRNPGSSVEEPYRITIPYSIIESDCILVSDFEQAIYFYSALEKFGEFSNFAPFGFEYENHYYPTVEHFYQSRKFMDEAYVALIRQAKTPKAAADLGKNKDKVMKPNWAAIKDEVMMVGVQQKFATHEKLRRLLIATGAQLIIENSPYDNYWGIGSVGAGRNQLGTTLMRVREQFSNK